MPLPDAQIQKQLEPLLERVAGKAARLHSLHPLPEAFTSSLEHKLRIELTHGSTAIEGNTLTLRETQMLVDEGITPQGAKQLREIHETINHHRAVLRLQELVRSGNRCDEASLCELHRLIMANIDDQRAGTYRKDRVLVTGAPLQPIRPEAITDAMSELSRWIDSCPLHPVMLAAEAHYRLVKIHPFYDGNGRTARLLFNGILLTHRYPLAVIPADARSRYITSIDEADRGQPLRYFELLCECVESSLDQYLSA